MSNCNNLILVIILNLFSIFQANALDSHPLDKNQFKDQFETKDIGEEIAIPWGLVQLPNQDILVAERHGKLRVIRQGRLLKNEISGLPKIINNGQGGLLDLALHPDFKNNSWLYFTYADSSGEGEGSNTALMRAMLDINSMTLSKHKMLYKAEENTTKGQHYGSRIAFDDDGFLYFSIGDRGKRDVNPQNITKDGGKIYRLHDDGSIPLDNPFIDDLNAKTAAFSYGHRNPQGLAFDHNTGLLWSHEHGPKGGDELNIIKAGKNYGWPVISYGINYNGTKFTSLTEKNNMEQPALYWVPSIAPSAMIMVTSDKYPSLKGKLLLGSMKFGYIVVVEIDNDKVIKQSQLLKGIGRVRSLLQGEDGFIYVGLDGKGIKKILPK